MKYLYSFLVLLVPIAGIAQTCDITASSNGDWNNTGTWTFNTGGTRVPGLTDNVCWNSAKTVYFPQQTSLGSTYSGTIASMQIGNDNFYIGDSDGNADYLGITGNLIATNSTFIQINSDGTLEIFGDVIINNALTLTVTGTLIVHGNFSVAANAQVAVTGSVTVDGSVSAGSASCLSVSGGGTFYSAGGCTVTGAGNNCTPTGTSFCASVPITLISFNAQAVGKAVQIRWSTASEINFDYFVLERSANGSQFSELTRIKGSGTSNVRKDYSYSDNNPFIGNSYYRLTAIDFDGYTEVFGNRVIHVTVNAGKNFFIVPNPIEGSKLKGGVNFDASNAQVVIFDRMGIIVDRYTLSGTEFEMQLPNLPNGVYFAQLQSGEYTKSVRFVVSQ